jgi:hypothetical protein
MLVQEDVLAQVVTEASAGQSNPRFVEETVGAFMRRQPIIGNYVASHQKELGVEGVVLVLLHAAILLRAVERAAGRKMSALAPNHLDVGAKRAGNEAELASVEPAIRDYLSANVAEDATLQAPGRRDTALFLLRVIAHSLVDRI